MAWKQVIGLSIVATVVPVMGLVTHHHIHDEPAHVAAPYQRMIAGTTSVVAASTAAYTPSMFARTI